MDCTDVLVTDVLVTSYLAFGKEGKVYQAELCDTHQPVAIKCIEKWEEQIVSLRKTLDFCRRLEHPNIVLHLHHQACRSINPLEPPVYLVIMELCRGGTLRQAIRRIVVSPYLLQKWTKETVEGLSYLHEHHCVHRDLKGENVLMTSRNLATASIKIADLSTIATRDEDFAGYGTYPFMAPEMIADRNPETDELLSRRGPAADIWSLGCVVIEMLTGTSPQFFRQCNGEKVQVNGEHAVLYFVMIGGSPTIPAGLPSDINHFVRGCLERNPCDRKSAPELKSHPFLTSPLNIVSNWVLPEPIGEIQEPAELQEFSVGAQRIVPVQLVRVVGVSVQGKVFQAERTDTNDIIAVKSILLDMDTLIRAREVNQLKTDFLVLTALHHPHIVRHIHIQEAPIVSDYDCPTCQVLMEFCEGPSLHEIIRKLTIPYPLLQKWIKQLVDGISYLHSQQCAHRDIRTQSVLLSSHDIDNCLVKISGFGSITRLTGETSKTNDRHFSIYSSPEMVRDMMGLGSNRPGTESDVWSLGCVVIEMVIGEYPHFCRKGFDGRKRYITAGESYFVTGLPVVPGNIPFEVEDFIQRCVQVNPGDRPRVADLKRHAFLTANITDLFTWTPLTRNI